MGETLTTQQFSDYVKQQWRLVKAACGETASPATDRIVLNAAYNIYEKARMTPKLMNGDQLNTLGAKGLLASQLLPDQLLPVVADSHGSPLNRHMDYNEAMRRLNGKDDAGDPERPLANRLAATLTRIMEDETLRAKIASSRVSENVADNVCENIDTRPPSFIKPMPPGSPTR